MLPTADRPAVQTFSGAWSRFRAKTKKQPAVNYEQRRVIGRQKPRRGPGDTVDERSREWPEERGWEIACCMGGDIADDMQQPGAH